MTGGGKGGDALPGLTPVKARVLLALIGGAAVACGAREDVTPAIAVQPGAAARAMALTSRFGAKEAPPAPAPGKARVHAMQAGEELGGPSVGGGAGDLVLENDAVVYVMARGTADVVDAADARARKDELGRLGASVGGRRVAYDSVTSGAAADGSSAWVEARGHDAPDGALAIVTRATLHAGDRALLLETTLTNGGDAPVGDLSLGDAIDWGSAEGFTSGTVFTGAVGRAASYALTSTEGTIAATSDGPRTDVTLKGTVTLPPRGSVAAARVLVVGERPDVASLVAELTRASGGALGSVEITLVDESGRAVRTPEGAKVVLAKAEGDGASALRAARSAPEASMTIRAAREGASFGGEVPPGEYAIAFAAGGGRRAGSSGSKSAPATVVVRAGEVARAALVVGEPGTLSFACVEPRGAAQALGRVPCKVSIAGIGGTPAPEIAPPLGAAGGLARNQLVAGTGKVAVAIAPGKYRVTASRGSSFSSAQWETDVLPGKPTWGPNEGATVLRPVVDARGYLAVEVGAPPGRGADAAALARDALLARAADGVDVVLGEGAPAADVAKQGGAVVWLAQSAALAAPDTLDAYAAGGTAALVSRLVAKQPVTAIARAPARFYVRVDDDGPVDAWGPDREGDLLRGLRERRDVVLTNGPFLRVTANDAPNGGLARPRGDHDVEVKVHVECTATAPVERVSLVRASGAPVPPQPVTPASRGSASGARVDDVTFHLRATADDAFVVVAEGPAASGEPAPRAMTGATWIDADGDGESLGRARPPEPPPPPEPETLNPKSKPKPKERKR